MKNTQLRKLTMAALFAALAVVCSPLSIPVGASKCFPVQHFVNIASGVFLGPWYSVGAAFVASLIRNLMGTGSLLAFPGSMCGAFLCGLLYRKLKKLPFAYIGELFGTAVIGGMLCFPIATMIMSQEAALFMYVLPFFISSCGGTIIAAIIVPALKKAGLERLIIGNSIAKSKEETANAR
ncbi:MAG: energy coupling factor transporter S component ThiW [Ruminococcus sp.]|nr:energy coupling factor transporter S component ThiW [Ruminococcus sp.]